MTVTQHNINSADAPASAAHTDTPVLDIVARKLHDSQREWARSEPDIDDAELCEWDNLDDRERVCYRRMAADAIRELWQLGAC